MSEFRNEIKLEDLRKKVPCKWRIQHKKDGWARLVSYIDARQCQQILDDVCGIDGWQCEHYEVKGNLFCRVGINTSKGWIWKSDVGKETEIEKEKGESSDCFKRACVMWGVGRFLYEMDPKKLPTKKHTNGKEYVYSIEAKKIIFDNDTLTRYLNWLNSKEVEAKEKKQKDEDKIKAMPDYKSEKS